ncbi:inner-membrane translocator [Desulfonatronospira thiodismutans ASO3-1]|uniref:Inner-membrane translocator n=1 Tax=Desulfonatronospira thiodismutans ASO3-1 TaxID=555779 RepID=D6SMB8_9BACT|nr:MULTISPECIES: branched-chain amino acid ABC transporter permease [Desulfonatronospira]EFI35829.1 inner-membrane translocator [Desulfonatronospira thiodismutans ASO3-1]RQD78968.1 MAG: branched-chain amino acid ABC transporter permease [Desulfonatronospira sp. MSAO_Bac3]
MQFFFEQLINGLAVGGIYALIALGYTMVYGVMRLINFAHGDLFTIGAYLGLTVLTSVAVTAYLGPFLGVILLMMIIMCMVGVVGVVLERVAYRPVRQADRLSAVVSALGASIFLSNLVMLIWGPRFRVYPDDILPRITLNILGLDVPLMRILVLLASLILMGILYYFVQKTKTGTAIRAVAIDHGASRLMGINVNRIISLVFLIGPALGGAAGVMVGLYYGQINFTMGWAFGLKAFIAAVLGGIGNIPGAMIGGLLLGVIEALGAAFISTAWKDGIAFIVLILILIFRPTGILGERVADKV